MSEIKRYLYNGLEDKRGPMVLYADHAAEVARLEAERDKFSQQVAEDDFNRLKWLLLKEQMTALGVAIKVEKSGTVTVRRTMNERADRLEKICDEMEEALIIAWPALRRCGYIDKSREIVAIDKALAAWRERNEVKG